MILHVYKPKVTGSVYSILSKILEVNYCTCKHKKCTVLSQIKKYLQILYLSWEFTSSFFSDCKIVECLRNIVCIHKYLQLQGNQHGVAFYLNCIRMYKPRNSLQAPSMCCSPVCTCCQCFLLGQEEMLCSNPPPRFASLL